MHAASSRKPPWRRVAGSPPSLVAAAGFTGQASTPWPERQGWPGPRPTDKASVDTATPCPGRACWSGSPSPTCHHGCSAGTPFLGTAILRPPLCCGVIPQRGHALLHKRLHEALQRAGAARPTAARTPRCPPKHATLHGHRVWAEAPPCPASAAGAPPAPGSREPQPQRGLAADRPPGAAPWCPTNYFGRRRQFSHEPGASR